MPWLGLPLFDEAKCSVPYRSESATSEQGARSVQGKAGSQISELLALYRTGAFTDHQVEQMLHWPIQRVCARRGALVKQGLVVKATVMIGPYKVPNQAWRAT